MLMNKERSLLMILDVQERSTPATENPREVITGCSRLLAVAKELGIPYFLTRQTPDALGDTIIDLRQAAGTEALVFDKASFSAYRNEEIRRHLEKSGRKQIILAGIETHIGVTQTALDLKAAGYETFMVSNACSSRDPIQNILALQRLISNGVDAVTSEMVFFEWLEKAEGEAFQKIADQYAF